jgi:cytochrome c oxidase subunit 4
MAHSDLTHNPHVPGTSHDPLPGEVHVHAVSPALLLVVFGALLVLTVITVAVTKIDFGDLNIWVAMGIAVLKATLVALYFMHLRWDSLFNGIILISALVFVGIFISATIHDSTEYKVNYEPPTNSLVQQP